MADEPRLLVRATSMTFYGGTRIRPGQTFTLSDPAHFNPRCMERVLTGTKDDIATAEAASPMRLGTLAGVGTHVESKVKRSGIQVRSAVPPAADEGI